MVAAENLHFLVRGEEVGEGKGASYGSGGLGRGGGEPGGAAGGRSGIGKLGSSVPVTAASTATASTKRIVSSSGPYMPVSVHPIILS